MTNPINKILQSLYCRESKKKFSISELEQLTIDLATKVKNYYCEFQEQDDMIHNEHIKKLHGNVILSKSSLLKRAENNVKNFIEVPNESHQYALKNFKPAKDSLNKFLLKIREMKNQNLKNERDRQAYIENNFRDIFGELNGIISKELDAKKTHVYTQQEFERDQLCNSSKFRAEQNPYFRALSEKEIKDFKCRNMSLELALLEIPVLLSVIQKKLFS